jgi:serpin B
MTLGRLGETKEVLQVKRVLLVLLALATIASGLAGCGQAQFGEIVRSAKAREASPDVSDPDLARQVDGNSEFALDMYQTLRGAEGNLFFSPHSISLALAMTYVGARGETATQMAEALSLVLPQEDLHRALNKLDAELAKRGEGAQGKDDGGFRLNIVNAIWGQQGFGFLPDFLDVLAQNYGAGLRTLDFIGASEEARVTINDWVATETEDRIQDLIPQGALGPLTRLVLTNAIYFNAAWAETFEESATADGPFHLIGGGQVTTPMMHQTEAHGYAEGDGFQAVELQYDGREMSMVILLPETGSYGEFEESLDWARVAHIIDALERRQVRLAMPRFEFESEFNLNQALSALGMPAAFTGAADFSGMTDEEALFISDVIHKAFVSVDEAGTEAAAATAVIVKATSAPAEPVVVTVDRPFLFLIRDIETGAILFIGRVMDPGS